MIYVEMKSEIGLFVFFEWKILRVRENVFSTYVRRSQFGKKPFLLDEIFIFVSKTSNG